MTVNSLKLMQIKFNNKDIAEKIAVRYLFFRNPIAQIIMIIPFFVSYTFLNFYQTELTPELSTLKSFSQLNSTYISNFVFGTHIAVLITVSIFILFRWHLHRNSGAYGYWLSLGISRMRFLMYASIYFLIYSTIGIIIGMVMAHFYFGAYFSLAMSISLIIQMIGNTILILGVGFLITEFISNPYVSVLLFLTFNAIFMSIENNMFRLYFSTDGNILSVFATISSYAFGALFMAIGIYQHNTAEIDLR